MTPATVEPNGPGGPSGLALAHSDVPSAGPPADGSGEVGSAATTPCIHTRHLAVGDGHDMAVHSFGRHWRDGGLPVLVLHGGPGSGQSPALWQALDPDRYHVIAPDQRGCGASRPAGAVHANHLDHLLADLRLLHARHVAEGGPPWLVLGGSWGATLAVAHAADCPQAVAGLMLRASFLGRPEDVAAFFAPPDPRASGGDAAEGSRRWQALCRAAGLDRDDRDDRADRTAPMDAPGTPGSPDSRPDTTEAPAAVAQWHGSPTVSGPCAASASSASSALHPVPPLPGLLAALARTMATGSPEAQHRLASAWAAWEQWQAAADSSPTTAPTGTPPKRPDLPPPPVTPALLHRYRVQAHFLADGCGLRPPLLERAARVPAVPVHLLHASDDRVCPLSGAQALAQALPPATGAMLQVVDGGGHQPLHPGMRAALRQALDHFARHRRWPEPRA